MKKVSFSIALILLLIFQTAFANGELSNYSSAAAEASAVVKSTGGRIYQLVGYNGSGSDQFIQLHNTTSLPANGAVPYRSFKALAGRNFSFDLPEVGLNMSTGIVICNSSTVDTKTIGSADCMFYLLYK